MPTKPPDFLNDCPGKGFPQAICDMHLQGKGTLEVQIPDIAVLKNTDSKAEKNGHEGADLWSGNGRVNLAIAVISAAKDPVKLQLLGHGVD